MSTPPEIVIPFEHYVELVDASDRMHFLELFGVDNWEGYDEAMQALQDYYDTEDQG